MTRNKNKKQSGFTLIELLVVIAIIGLLSTISIIALNQARSKARDARRVADMHQLVNALNIYYNVHGEYPNISVVNSQATFLSPLINEGLMKDLDDPWNTPYPFYYVYTNSTWSGFAAYSTPCNSSDLKYIVRFGLENEDDLSGFAETYSDAPGAHIKIICLY